MTRDEQLFEYLLRLGDSPLILAQRLGEWVGHGPVLEEDIAQTNVGLDLLGQARLWLSYAGEVEARYAPPGRDEDRLAFLRDGADFRNLLLVEQPNGSFADTTARQFLFDAWHLPLLRALAGSRDDRIGGIAAKAREGSGLPRRALRRLGDPPGRRHRRVARADAGRDRRPVDVHRRDVRARRDRPRADRRRHRRRRPRARGAVAASASTRCWPRRRSRRRDDTYMQQGGKRGVHTEHLGHLLAEMQVLQRAYPGARW